MKFVSRAEWGAKPSIRPLTPIAGTLGVKIHYEGSPVPEALLAGHGSCAPHMRALQESHLANTAEGYSDIAYSLVVCPHGHVFEGRGAKIRCAANGNQELNKRHYAVCAMVGTEGVTEPTPEMLGGLRDAVEYLRREGAAGIEIKGHRDGWATACPGDRLYDWIKAGAPGPTAPSAPAPSGHPAWPGRYLRNGSSGEDVRIWQRRMRERGWSLAVDGAFGPETERVVRQFQTEKGLGTDGIIGPVTWGAAWTAPVQ